MRLLQRRETMGIRTKHFEASFEAGLEASLEGLKAMEIGAKQCDKEGPCFGPQNVRKSGRAKMGLPSTPWNGLIQLFNVIDTISKRWRNKKAFNISPFHIFP